MLADVAAFLSSSGALGGVAEAFVAHELNQQIYSNVVTLDPSIQHPSGLGDMLSPFLSPGEYQSARILSTPLDPSLLPTLGGNALLDQLSLMPGADVSRFIRNNPASVSTLLVSPPRAVTVVSWWSALSASSQKSMLKAAPEVVGNLDGVPFQVRDAANRLYLKQSIDRLKASIESGVGRAMLVQTRHHLDILKQIERTLATKDGDPQRQLLTFDPAGEARAAVVVGNLATADYVSYLVPGMFFTVQGQMYDWTAIAQDLYKEQAGWMKVLSKTDGSLAHKTTATVAWLGYTTPGVLDIASLDRANQGANFLGHAVQGIQAVRVGSEPFVSLVTHSYGSTAAMIELARGGMKVDALVIIGSPGGATQSASALSVRGDNVYVGEAAWDPIVNTAFYGSDPGAASFGAHKMGVSGGVDPISHRSLSAAIGHLGYFDAGTEAMRNLALIGLDRGALVTNGTSADASRTLAIAQ